MLFSVWNRGWKFIQKISAEMEFRKMDPRLRMLSMHVFTFRWMMSGATDPILTCNPVQHHSHTVKIMYGRAGGVNVMTTVVDNFHQFSALNWQVSAKNRQVSEKNWQVSAKNWQVSAKNWQVSAKNWQVSAKNWQVSWNSVLWWAFFLHWEICIFRVKAPN
jgi:hypothetical protein